MNPYFIAISKFWKQKSLQFKQAWQAFLTDKTYRRQCLQKVLRIGLFSAAGMLALGIVFFISVWLGLFGPLPSQKDLASIDSQVSTEIYAAGGQLLGKYFIYDRTHAKLDDLSPDLINCLLATEDVRFYKHRGTDYRSLGRVLVKTLVLGRRSSGGGSTISQQLAKNLYGRNDLGLFSMPVNKVRESIIAYRMERVYAKDDILLLYLNTIPFGENVFGISAASLRFFNKNPRDLKIEEAAVLVGMLKASSYYNPRRFPERSTARRNTVITQLEKYQHLTKEQGDSLRSLELKLNYNPMTHNQGPAPYFRERLRLQLMELLREYNTHNQTSYNLYTDGLKIYTTIDYDLQIAAEESMRRIMPGLQSQLDRHYQNLKADRSKNLLLSLMRNSKQYRQWQELKLSTKEIEDELNSPQAINLFSWDGGKNVEISLIDSAFKAQQLLHSGLVSLDPRTGAVKAWVGGNDFRYFQFDQVLSRRQAGSVFKPFVYAVALKKGMEPCEYVSNAQRVYEEYDNWSPSNANNEHDGYYSMSGALAKSSNTVAVHYIMQTGTRDVAELARLAGIRSPLPQTPSLALGTAEVSLLEMTAAYAIFANEGHPVTPHWLLKVEDAHGKILYEAPRPKSTEPILDQETYLLMQRMLKMVADSGTAASLRGRYGIGFDIGGKTGTTQNNSDGWFVGFTPGLLTGVWTGLENPAFATLHPAPLSSTQTAVPIWGTYMQQLARKNATRHYTLKGFETLPDSLMARINCSMYLDELPPQSWFDWIFGGEPQPADSLRKERPRPSRERRERRSVLRRFFEDLF